MSNIKLPSFDELINSLPEDKREPPSSQLSELISGANLPSFKEVVQYIQTIDTVPRSLPSPPSRQLQQLQQWVQLQGSHFHLTGPLFSVHNELKPFYKQFLPTLAVQVHTPAPFLFVDQFCSPIPRPLDIFWLNSSRTRFLVCSPFARDVLKSMVSRGQLVCNLFDVCLILQPGISFHFAARYRSAYRMQYNPEGTVEPIARETAYQLALAGAAAVSLPETLQMLRNVANQTGTTCDAKALVGELKGLRVGNDPCIDHKLVRMLKMYVNNNTRGRRK